MLAVVIKRGIVVAGIDILPGQLVDTEGMRNADKAIRSRHLRPAAASEIAAHESNKRTPKK